MPKLLRYPLQAVNYSLFMLLVWYFSESPAYTRLAPDQAVITVAFPHVGKRLEACHKLTQAELNRLPPNMRAPLDCPRERSPVTVTLLLDDKRLFKRIFTPPGLYHDLGIDIYFSVRVPAGKHRLVIQMNDDIHTKGSTYTYNETVSLQPSQLLLVNFDADAGKFVIR